MSDTASLAAASIRSIVDAALVEMADAATMEEARLVERNAKTGISVVVWSAFRQIEEDMRGFRSAADEIVISASEVDQCLLRRLAGSMTGQIGARAGEAKRSITVASHEGRMLLQDGSKENPPAAPPLPPKKMEHKIKVRFDGETTYPYSPDDKPTEPAARKNLNQDTHLPVELKAQFQIRLFCDEDEVDCVQFEIHIFVDEGPGGSIVFKSDLQR